VPRAHIWYLDDDEAIVFLVRRRLQRMGFAVEGHTNAREALAALQDPGVTVDLVVSDQNMPVMSGLEFAAAVKALRPTLRVALSSGVVSDELRQRAQAVGVDALIDKGVEVETLFDTIAQLAIAGPSVSGGPG
jgi:CheY-like chemotaxis protein